MVKSISTTLSASALDKAFTSIALCETKPSPERLPSIFSCSIEIPPFDYPIVGKAIGFVQCKLPITRNPLALSELPLYIPFGEGEILGSNKAFLLSLSPIPKIL